MEVGSTEVGDEFDGPEKEHADAGQYEFKVRRKPVDANQDNVQNTGKNPWTPIIELGPPWKFLTGNCQNLAPFPNKDWGAHHCRDELSWYQCLVYVLLSSQTSFSGLSTSRRAQTFTLSILTSRAINQPVHYTYDKGFV